MIGQCRRWMGKTTNKLENPVNGMGDGDEVDPGYRNNGDKDSGGDKATRRRVLRASVALAATGIVDTAAKDGQQTAAQGDAISILIPGIGNVGLLTFLVTIAAVIILALFLFLIFGIKADK